MGQWHMITFSFAKAPKVTELQPVFDQQAEDWLRLNVHTWLAYSNLTSAQWYEVLRLHLTQDDSVLVMRLDATEYFGWEPEWVWNKIQKKR